MATGTMEEAVTDIEEAGTGETVQQKKNRLRNEAEREIVNRHRDELNKLTEAKFVEQGLKYTRRLSDSEKAAKKVEEYFNQFPELREQFASN